MAMLLSRSARATGVSRGLLRSNPPCVARLSTAAELVPVAHKPVPAKVKRKAAGTRHKKAAPLAAKANGLAPRKPAFAVETNGASVGAAAQKLSEEEILAKMSSARKPNGRVNGKLNGAMTHTNGERTQRPARAVKPSVVVVQTPVEAVSQEPEPITETAQSVDVPAPAKTPNAATRKESKTEKITLTLQEIAALQKTLPSVSEIAQLVARLRKESFQKGHTLFDLYRNYGNPFLDENFLIPGVLACCEAKKPAEGIRIVRDMLNQGRKVDETTLRTLLKACDETSLAYETIQLWDLMERAGVTLTLDDFNLFLDICYRQEYLDGAIKVLKQLRLMRSISVHTYMHWLLRSSMVWRSDAFFDILMEMRLSGVEPEISSLTSLESGRKDRALTVMEGVRAVGLDPCFAMSSVYSSMQLALYGNGPNAEPFTPRDLRLARERFGNLTPRLLDWPVKPIPQVLETQAAGLILQQETFRRLKRKQVNHIDDLLQMLPITANMTLNLRKQLQRMSLLVNTHRVRRDTWRINTEYESGKSLIELSTTHNYPPVSLMRVILRHRGMSTISVKKALSNPLEYLSKRDQYELKKAIEYDSIHKSDPFIGSPSYNADSLETAIQHFIKAQGIRIKNQEELCLEQEERYGRRVISPDILLLDPVIINGTPIRWIDAKNYYGAHIVSKRLIAKQLASYVKEWGPGAIVFGMGYSDMFSVPGVLCLDTTPFPSTRKEVAKVRAKSLFYSFVNLFNWRKHLGSELTQEYPAILGSATPTISAETQANAEQVEAEEEEQETAASTSSKSATKSA